MTVDDIYHFLLERIAFKILAKKDLVLHICLCIPV